jgi:hypothetical protein
MDRTDALTILLQKATKETEPPPVSGAGGYLLQSPGTGAPMIPVASQSELLDAASTLGRDPNDRPLEFLRAMAIQNVAPIKNDPSFATVWTALRPNDPPNCGDATPILPLNSPDTYDPATHLFTVTVYVSATKSVSNLKPVLDPQAWDGQSPFFEESYVMPDADIDSKIPPSPTRLAKTLGTAWTGYLYEKVRFQDFVFQNVLRMDCQSPGSSYKFSYDMHRCAWSTLPQAQPGPGCLVKNFGDLTAVPDGAATKITARKSFRFDDRAPYTGYQLGALLRDGLRAGWATALSLALC